MNNAILDFLGWYIVPSLATKIAQSLFYGIVALLGRAKPVPGSPLWLAHRRRIHITIVLAYLLFTVHTTYAGVTEEGDFYRALGIPHSADDRSIKSRFRRLATIHHPDKVSLNAKFAPSDTTFLLLRQAQDTLLNPASRFAYDRFGPEIVKWERCSIIRDYLHTAFISIIPGYVTSAVLMIMASMMGYFEYGRFWRYFAGASLVLLEFHTATRPHFPLLFTHLINPAVVRLSAEQPLLPFQLIILARKANVAIFVAIAQLGPHFRAPEAEASGDAIPAPLLRHLEQIARSNETEAGRLLDLSLVPYGRDPKGTRKLREQIRAWLVQNTIKADPAVREAVGQALDRRRDK